ncbi:sigma 54-interacting transcriptional regulator [bacterium]|nr:sigma 54-interacting transcriptional regulator [bacterium]
MSIAPLHTRILDTIQAGWIFLDREYRIVRYNRQFQDWFPELPALKQPVVTDVLPETVGLESPFDDMVSGKKPFFFIPYIQKEPDPGKEQFFNLYILPSGIEKEPLLILMIDDTELAAAQRKIQQQAYEIKLMHNMLNMKTRSPVQFIGSSEPVQQLKAMILKVSRVGSSTVLIQGETGTGKSLIAQLIHLASENGDGPFLEFNCAAVPESLLESELFGHEKGAFTHAVAQRKGLLEEARGGTLFLDEIGDIPLNLQAKLLTMLESRKFRRLGSTREIKAQFRLIAATHRDLQSMIREGTFRQDLYYRIQVVTLHCPPLRELGDDIMEIASHFIHTFNLDFKKQVRGMNSEVKHMLRTHSWPGNVRELRNVIERAMIFTENKELLPGDIQLTGQGTRTVSPAFSLPEDGLSFEQLEKQLLEQALERCRGNQSQAARLLKMSRDTFRYRLEKHHMLT